MASLKKISNTEIIIRTNIDKSKFYRLKKEFPELIKLVKKGILLDLLTNEETISHYAK